MCFLCARAYNFTFILQMENYMQEDAIRWDKRHAQGFMPQEPSTILQTYTPLLRTYIERGRVSALDIACGNGRNAKFLAHMGFSVLGVDISQVALDSLTNTECIQTLCADLDYFDIKEASYDVVLNFYFLDRRLFEGIKNGLKSGGIVIFETFCAVPKIYDTEIFSQLPTHRSLKNGELERAFRGWKVLHNAYGTAYRSVCESTTASHSTESKHSQNVCLTQTFIAQKP